jgi:exodeoxyribonuclease V alpha subunit
LDIEIQGNIEKITFHSQENGFTIGKMKVQGRNDLVTVVGTLPSITSGEELRLSGQWVVHPKFGNQFSIVSYEVVRPATLEGIERYLGSGLIKGIGPVMAKRLVAKFGLSTLNVIENEIHRLSEVGGIGEKRISMISAAWAEQKDIREVMIFLQEHGVGPAFAVKIFKQYGKEAIKKVRENPYRLAEDIFGIGFLTADKIAEKLGISKDSQIRAKAGILFTLQQLADNGHVYYPYEPLIEECKKILDTKKEVLEEAFGSIAAAKKVIIEDLISGEMQQPNNKAVYLAKLHVAECRVTELLRDISQTPKVFRNIDKDKAFSQVQGELGITLSGNQARAVRESLDHKVMVITGGPGTGKTTIINAIIKLYMRLEQKVLLTAPTGRAAKRMSETTGQEAKTVHRLLEYNPKMGGFQRDSQNPLEADLVVIDETSMVDTILMHHFLDAVPREATLIFVGDVDQLPSVGAGNVLKDIIDSGAIPTVRLTEIFRQAGESLIILNAHRVNSGQAPLFQPSGDQPQDFYCFEIEDPEKVLTKIVELVKEKIPAKFGFEPINDIQVLTPMHRGVVGAGNLNVELQKSLNPSLEEITRMGKVLKIGDKVMQIRNNYDKNVFNGDLGRITAIDRESQEVLVDFEGRPISYEFQELDEIMLAYAVSVHKSQGSEYPVVVIPVVTQHYILLQRNLLYTAITRGKKLVVLVGTKKAINIAVRNNKQQQRYTLLKGRLAQGRQATQSG